jgi:hypothetical protein
MKYKYLYYNGTRPKNCQAELKRELLEYLREEYKKQHIPSRREIEGKFHFRFTTLFKDINTVYQEAGLKYKLTQNQSIKSSKAEILLKIILKNLEKLDLELVKYRDVRERGIDIITKRKDRIIGIELKAYNKREKLKCRDIKQVNRFIKDEKLDEAIIITTTDISDKKLPNHDNISIIKYSNLILSLNIKKDKSLEYIREYSVNISDSIRDIKKQIILNYVLDKYKNESKKPGYNDILKELHLDIYTYFKDLFEIYKTLGIPPPLKNMNGRNSKKPDPECISLWKEEFKKFILSEIEKGNKYPSGVDIGKHFGISHIWNIVNTSQLYKELNLKTYLERKRKTTSVQGSRFS